MEYNFRDIEKKWQDEWKKRHTYKTENHSAQPKYYALDMFPYPSGAGLHVGHPLGYIASDIVARYKRLTGHNVLHPMGFDSFGLPAEQYAIQTGQHPDKTTRDNIARYKEQMDKIGFSFDWDREFWTSNPDYYKWTQWIFLQIFNSWYNVKAQKAENISTLEKIFETEGFSGSDDRILTGDIEHDVKPFTAGQWKNFSEKEKSDVLMNFRLAYLGEAWVNWCPQLGTVLANDEVKDGVSERGGYPVERKRMPQWSMRITSYADRLLNDLEKIDWPESIKEAQRNWIGRSEGSSLKFSIAGFQLPIEVFTTRPDTVFGVTFITLAPENDLVQKITTPEYKTAVDAYVNVAKNKSERERQAEVKKVTGQFTGAYAVHPFNGKKIPVWIGEYVLAGYGTGAVMGVPAHDSRDHAFAKHFGLEILQVIEGPAGHDFSKESFDSKETKCMNSDFLNGLEVKDAIKKIIVEIEKRKLGKGKVNYRLRDAAFGRQRYWGEPIPVYYKDGIPYPVDENDLPIVLPEIEKFLPTETGEPPLARAKNWVYRPHPQPLTRGKGSDDNDAVAEDWDFSRKYFTTSPEKWKLLKERARNNRKQPTEAENILWQELRNKRTGFKIRRQHAIDIFIVDFVCMEKQLVIEIDGGYHNDPDQKEYDEQRTFILEQLGYKIIRFTNDAVVHNTANVVSDIRETLVSRNKVLPTGEDLGGVSYPLETTTMPGWAGSSWYYLRYMDPHNENEFVSKEAANYWQNVDLYLGGAEHATGHLLYVRFWTKFLFDIGKIPFDEPAKKLINQGMIQGVSAKVHRIHGFMNVHGEGGVQKLPSIFISAGMEKHPDAHKAFKKIMKDIFPNSLQADFNPEGISKINVPIEFVDSNGAVDIEKVHGWANYKFFTIHSEDGKFYCSNEVEKMSKSKYNVVTPDSICENYGADTLRLYEMFLGPLEQSKPWNTNGITGVHGFLKRFWRLFFDDERTQSTEHRAQSTEHNFKVTNDPPTESELKILNRTLKKIREDIDRFSFNTCVSQFMIATNELMELKCSKRAILEPLVIALSPFAPHIAEELWENLGHKESVTKATFPSIDEKYLVDDTFDYPVQVNGKVRFTFTASLQLNKEQIEKEVLSSAEAQKYLDGKTPKKVIVVPKRIVNIVI